MAEIKNLSVKIGADTTGLQKGFQQAEKSTDDFSGAIRQAAEMLNTSLAGIKSVVVELNNTVGLVLSNVQQGFSAVSSASVSTAQSVATLTAESAQSSKSIATQTERIDELTKAAIGLGDEIGKTREFDKMQKELEETNKKLDEAEQNLKQTKAEAQGLKSAFSGITQLAAGLFTIQKAVQFTLTGIQNAMTLESSTQQIERTMGENAAIFTAWAQNNADAYNMSEKAATQYGAVFSNLISSFETDTANITGYTTKLLKSAAVVSSATGRTMDDTLERIRSGMLGNTESIEDLGINVNVSMIEATKAFKQFAGDKSWEQLDFKTQQQIRLFAILEQATDKYGDTVLDNASSQYAQAMAQVENATTDFGNALLPAVTVILPAFAEIVRFVTPAITGFGEGISAAAQAISNASPATKTFLAIAVGMAVAIPAVTLAVKGLTLAKAALSAVVAILTPQVITLSAALKSLFGWLGLIAAVIGIFGVLNSHTENVADNLPNFDDTGESAEAAASGVDGLTESVDELKKSKNGLRGLDELNIIGGGSLTGGLVSASDLADIATATEGVLGFSASIEDLTASINDGNVTNSISERLSEIGKAFDGIGEDIGDLFWGTEDESYKALNSLNERVRLLFGAGWTSFWGDVGKAIYEIFVEKDYYSGLQTLDTQIRNLFGDDWSDFWGDVGSDMYDAFATQKDPILGVLSALNEAIRKIFGQGWVDFWGDVGSEMYKALNPEETIEYHKKGSSITVGKALPFSPTPAYASGGLPPKGQFFIAQERGPELVGRIGNTSAVANQSQIRDEIYNAAYAAAQAAGAGSAENINLYATIEVDGDVIGEKALEYSRRNDKLSNGR